ncbi:hypothetical protein Tco_1341549 [Tanacetum coccineum]
MPLPGLSCHPHPRGATPMAVQQPNAPCWWRTTENKHPRGVILQTARTLFVYKNPNAPCWRERRGNGDGGDVMVASVGRQPEEGAARGGEWGSGLGRSEEEEHILKLTGKLRRKSFPAAARRWWPE